MAKHVIDTPQESSWQIDKSSDTWILTKGTMISVSSMNAIFDDQQQHDNKIVINGSVKATDFMGTSYAIQIYGVNTDIIVGNSGILTATSAVALTGDGQSLTNHGMVDAEQTAVYIYNAHDSVDNYGTIDGAAAGINAFGDAAKIVNHQDGVITSAGNAVYAFGDRDITVVNDGRIEGGISAITLGEGKDHVTNHGKLVGDVNLGDRNDVFDTRGGKVNGTVDGGKGDDTYLVGNAAPDINESFIQGGIDTVKSTVSFAINTAIENITLLGGKDIDATGSDAGNVLRGNSGDNSLRGLGGADLLIDGKGNDRLFGGELGDTFMFKAGHGHDVIADFDAVEGDHIDLSGIAAIKNFKDLVNHHLDVSGDDLSIAAGDDLIRIKNADEADLEAGTFDFA